MDEHKVHITPIRTYVMVALMLMILTAITVTVSFIDLGPYNVSVALLIASIKALLVAFFFMHLFYDNKIYQASVFQSSNRQFFDSLMSQSCTALCDMMSHTMSSNTA